MRFKRIKLIEMLWALPGEMFGALLTVYMDTGAMVRAGVGVPPNVLMESHPRSHTAPSRVSKGLNLVKCGKSYKILRPKEGPEPPKRA